MYPFRRDDRVRKLLGRRIKRAAPAASSSITHRRLAELLRFTLHHSRIQTCTTSGTTGGCAIQASQSGLN